MDDHIELVDWAGVYLGVLTAFDGCAVDPACLLLSVSTCSQVIAENPPLHIVLQGIT